ncbi:Recombination protein recR [Desulfovibrio sp. X2]|uniref:recombination mediator RecR n=1 Tax=Desulfovibrio sp. X2 TaxID=941449 RepID=UPI000358ACF1|nr:recombination mediator RecR [Desulfovibrio sp. X2]EPR37604.1 Recombination protein recR [Desulfovibrio sp. X2]
MEKSALPAPLRELVERLAGLPGLGPKSALRIALTVLKWPREKADALGGAILELREKLCFCERCLSLAESSPCPLCTDPAREQDKLCLVGEWDSLLTMEEGGFYKGQYMVLGGLLAPLDGVDAGQLEFRALRERLAEGEVAELILALGTTLEAEATASYVKNMIERDFPNVQLTRLAQGIPLGAEVKFVDRETLRQSLLWRQKL